MSMIGLMAGIIAPDLLTMTDRISFAMNREKIEQAIAGLPYEAYRRKEDLLLDSTERKQDESADLQQLLPLNAETKSAVNFIAQPILAKAATLALPEGWRLTVPQPILYRAAGYCNGGTIEINIDALVYEYELKAPDCRPLIK